jgi:RsiW-degrading membrane proteinase PrsW (M82 family)
VSWFLAGTINSFFAGIMGKDASAKFEAPFVEELLKPLGLVILAAVLLREEKRLRTKKKRPVRIDWLRSMKIDYAIGYASGLTFGVLESWLSYGTFYGLREVTPFFHAFTTGMVGIGVYFVLTKRKRGLVKLISIYLLAVFLHSAWNSGYWDTQAVLGISTMIIGLIIIPQILLRLGRRPAQK